MGWKQLEMVGNALKWLEYLYLFLPKIEKTLVNHNVLYYPRHMYA